MARVKMEEQIEIPEGVSCEFSSGTLKCKKDSEELSKKIDLTGIDVKVEGNKVILSTKKGSKNELKMIMTYKAHIKNMLSGLKDKFVYTLEVANVHFPMTLKIEGNRVAINNFLGEKNPRYAEILPNVKVEIKGQNITISSTDRESAGQTAANLEYATKVVGRDRRVFQDGIYITSKPERRN